jgi:hypothetical protein
VSNSRDTHTDSLPTAARHILLGNLYPKYHYAPCPQ